MKKPIDVPGKIQNDLIYYAGVRDMSGIAIPCSLVLKRNNETQIINDLERGDFICIIRKRNIRPDKKEETK